MNTSNTSNNSNTSNTSNTSNNSNNLPFNSIYINSQVSDVFENINPILQAFGVINSNFQRRT